MGKASGRVPWFSFWYEMETRTYPCGDKNVPVTVIIGITLYQPVIGVMMAVLGLHG